MTKQLTNHEQRNSSVCVSRQLLWQTLPETLSAVLEPAGSALNHLHHRKTVPKEHQNEGAATGVNVHISQNGRV